MPGFFRRLFSSRPAAPPALRPAPDAGVGGVERVEHGFRMELDDWQSVELVHQGHLAAVEKEMRSISAIAEGQDGTYGWTGIHLRHEIKEPLLPAEIPLQALLDLFPRRREFKGVIFWGDNEGLEGRSFAFRTGGGLSLYGDQYPGSAAGLLQSICFEPCYKPDKHALPAELETLAQFAARQQLYLIGWNQEFCSQPDAGRYMKFFEQYK